MKIIIAIILLTVGFLHAEEKPPCCRETSPATPLAEKSLYLLESTWTSDFGKDVKLSVLRGRPQIVAMFFTTCEYACPIIIENMKSIEQAMPENLRNKVDFLLVSFDIERGRHGEALLEESRDFLAAQVHGRGDDVGRGLAA